MNIMQLFPFSSINEGESSSPYLYGSIFAGRGEQLVVRRPGNNVDSKRVTMIGKDRSASRGVPDLCGFITAARCEALAIRGPGNGVHRCGMSIVAQDMFASRSIPHVCSMCATKKGAATPRGKQSIVRRPDNGIHYVAMSNRQHMSNRSCFPG